MPSASEPDAALAALRRRWPRAPLREKAGASPAPRLQIRHGRRDVRRADGLRVLPPFAESPLADVAPRAGDGRAGAGDRLGQLRERVVHVSRRHVTFSKKDGKFLVRTDGADGALHDYEVAWTFGFYPLQQYLIRFPKGRVQALNVVWDARPKAEGGQRWFHLYPDENVTHDDVLHWTGPYQNWNFMCADCHSTNVKKGYDAAADTTRRRSPRSTSRARPATGRARRTSLGPGREGAPRGRDVGEERRPRDAEAARRWAVGDRPRQDDRRRTVPRTDRSEVETCARCHARRSVVAEGYAPGRPLMDFYRPALLDEALYYPDGQLEEEVYEYGSFLQSLMYAKGVTCTDCHDAHTMTLRAPGDAVCGRCHAPEACRRRSTISTRQAARARAARAVTCRRGTTWSSTRGTTTRSASRVRISRRRSGRRTPARRATRRRASPGRRPRSRSGGRRRPRNRTPERRSTRGAKGSRGRGASSPRSSGTRRIPSR